MHVLVLGGLLQKITSTILHPYKIFIIYLLNAVFMFAIEIFSADQIYNLSSVHKEF